MTNFTTKIIKLFSRSNCSFKTGDAVEEIGGDGELMMVVEVLYAFSLKAPLVDCTWHDRESKSRRVRTFRLCQLKYFNWDAAQKKC